MSNDLIKRDLAIAYASSGLVRKIDGEDWIRISEVKQSLNDVPTVPLPDFKEGYKQAIIDGKTNFQRPQGEWKITGDATCECQFCHYQHVYVLSPKESGLNFCNHCGADMRGEEE